MKFHFPYNWKNILRQLFDNWLNITTKFWVKSIKLNVWNKYNQTVCRRHHRVKLGGKSQTIEISRVSNVWRKIYLPKLLCESSTGWGEATQFYWVRTKKWQRVLSPGTTCLCCHRWQPVVTPVPAAELLTRAWKLVCIHADKKQMSVWGVSNVKTKQTEHMWPALCWLQRLEICGDRTGPPWWSACCWARWAAGGIEKFSGAWIMDKSIMSIATS